MYPKTIKLYQHLPQTRFLFLLLLAFCCAFGCDAAFGIVFPLGLLSGYMCSLLILRVGLLLLLFLYRVSFEFEVVVAFASVFGSPFGFVFAFCFPYRNIFRGVFEPQGGL